MSQVTVVLALSDLAENNRFSQELSGVEGLRVASRTTDLAATYAYVEEHTPDAVIISSALAAQPEFEVMRALFATFDVRWLVIRDVSAPRGRHQSQKSDLFEMSISSPVTDVADTIFTITRSKRRSAPIASPRPASADFGDQIILIGSSTGGIDALLSILKHFPTNCPPTVIVQHTGAGFGQSLAGLLDRQCAPKVLRAEEARRLQAGEIILAAGCKAHLEIGGVQHRQVRLKEGAAVSGHMPSVDVLFRSAVPTAGNCVAVQLTGMGRDGAAGLRMLRDAGARTFAQDEATSVVYGMPKAAVEMGGVQEVLALPIIGPALLDSCKMRKSA